MKKYDTMVLDIKGLFSGCQKLENRDPEVLARLLDGIRHEVKACEKVAYADFGRYSPKRFDPAGTLGRTNEEECYSILAEMGWRTVYSPSVPPADLCLRLAERCRGERFLFLSGDPKHQAFLPFGTTFAWVYLLHGEVELRFF